MSDGKYSKKLLFAEIEAESETEKSKAIQKSRIKREYAKKTYMAAKERSIGSIKEQMQRLRRGIQNAVVGHPEGLVSLLLLSLLIFLIMNILSSCSVLGTAIGNVTWSTSYTAEDADINGAEADYDQMEKDLRDRIGQIENEYPDYDEYNYYVDEINHNPYELASYLTVKFENYTRDQVQITLQSLFDQQYDLTLEEKVETKTHSDGEEYDYYILNVYLKNKGLGKIILKQGMDEGESKRYTLLNQTYGNRKDLFESDIYAEVSEDYTDYDIPGEALTNQKFANLIQEAEKYLGYPYVWGGSNPSTSFDCSGFISWVLNHSGNGWNVGRQTANGLKSICNIIPTSEAKPGDLIFFKGTYSTTGASHVGIYVGNGMMLHCGNPIQYTSVETDYWKKHFYCFGRLP